MLTKLSNKVVADISLLIIRVILGVIFIAHGYPKLFVFGVPGFAKFLSGLGVPLPEIFAVIVALVEFVGGIVLILGIFSRWAGLLIAINMIVATLLVKVKVGLIAPMDKPGTGAELDLALFACALTILVFGPGSISIELGILKKELA
ncbi:MAG: DoxX family protein [Candidatus Kryptonium sp.]